MAKILYCNKCGSKMGMWDIQEDFSMQRKLGYGSKYDEYNLDLDLCCNCMDKLIESCIITPVHFGEADWEVCIEQMQGGNDV